MAKYTIIHNTFNKLIDGTSPVAIRIAYSGQRKLINIANVAVMPEDWDDTNWVHPRHPKALAFNKLIRAKDTEVEDLFDDLRKRKNNMTIEKIIAILSPEGTATTFFEFLIEYVEEYKTKKKIALATNLEDKAKALWRFHNKKASAFPVKQTKQEKYSTKSIFRKAGGRTLSFGEIDQTFLRKLDLYLKVEIGWGERSIYNLMNLIRIIYNRAIKSKTISKDLYPFDDYKLVMPESQKVGLDENEIRILENTQLTNKKSNAWIDAKNAWLFSFCFGGARISDVLLTRWEDFKNGRLYYTMGKNNKPVSIEIPERVQKILNYYEPYKEQYKGFVFPALTKANLKDPRDIELKLRNAIRYYNRLLEAIRKEGGITKKMNPHAARHSFGKITGDKISPQLLQLIYRHSDIKTSMNYQQNWINNDKVDEAIKNIVNF